MPEDISRRIAARAQKTGASLNKTVIEMLSETETVKGRRHSDLDFLAGAWSAEEADELGRLLEKHRLIDAELWK